MKRPREEGEETSGAPSSNSFDVHYHTDATESGVTQWKDWLDSDNMHKGSLTGLHASTRSTMPIISAPPTATIICRLTRRKAPTHQPHSTDDSAASTLIAAIKSFLLTTPIISSEANEHECGGVVVDNSHEVTDCLRRRHVEYAPYPSLTEPQLDVVDVYYCAVLINADVTKGDEKESTSSPLSSLVSVLAFARNARPRQAYLQLFLTAHCYRKLGVGKALMYVALDAEFAISDTSAIWLHTMEPINQSHSAAGILDVAVTNDLINAVQRLYAGVGFQVRRRLKGYYAHPVEDLRLCMEEAKKELITTTEALLLAYEFKQVTPIPSHQPPIPRIDGVEMTLTRGDYIKHLPQRRVLKAP